MAIESISRVIRKAGLLFLVLLLPVALLQGQTAATATSTFRQGKCVMGDFSLEEISLHESAPASVEYTLRYGELDMLFHLQRSRSGEEWTVSRQDNSALARYQTENGKVFLLNGIEQVVSLDAAGSDPTDKPDPNAYRPLDPSQTWLFGYDELRLQQRGAPYSADSLPEKLASQYASLLLSALKFGPKPLVFMELVRQDWPAPFDLIGLPAYEARAASWWYRLRSSSARKQEGDMASGNFALVSPDLGLSLAAGSGWVALASAAYSPEEGFVADCALPYGMTLNGTWPEQSSDRLPAYWTLLQTQNAGPAGINRIYTTPVLPGMALILTQSPDSTRLMGCTVVYQPYMAGVSPPRLLPPVAPAEQSVYAAQTMFWNAALEWALFEGRTDRIAALAPPDFTYINPSRSLTSIIAHQVKTGAGISAPKPESSVFIETRRCPGSDSPVQEACIRYYLNQLVQPGYGFGAAFQFVRYELAELDALETPDGRIQAVAYWEVVHRDDAGLAADQFRHPHATALVYRMDDSHLTGIKSDFEADLRFELGFHPAQVRQ